MLGIKYLIIFIAAVASLYLSWSIGPISGFGSFTAIDNDYIQTIQKQYYFTGITTAAVTYFIAYLLRANTKIVIAILLSAGAIWVAFINSSDSGFTVMLVNPVLEFMLPYTIIGLGVLLVFLAINKKWPRLS